MGSPPWLVDGFRPSAFREGVEGGVEDGESVGGSSIYAARGGLEEREGEA